MRNTLKSLVLLWLLTAAGCQKVTQVPVQRQSDYAVRIGAVLPRNWELNESNGQIVLSRKEALTAYGCVGLDISLLKQPDRMKEMIERSGSKEEYKIRLRITPRVEFAEYSRIKTANERITVTKSTVIENREFFEHDAMRSFDPGYRELPEYFDEHSSIYLETTLHPGECVYPYEAAIECEHVLTSLNSLFRLYDPAPAPRSLGWPTAPMIRVPSPWPLHSGAIQGHRPNTHDS